MRAGYFFRYSLLYIWMAVCEGEAAVASLSIMYTVFMGSKSKMYQIYFFPSPKVFFCVNANLYNTFNLFSFHSPLSITSPLSLSLWNIFAH